jgi:hypothetical protein
MFSGSRRAPEMFSGSRRAPRVRSHLKEWSPPAAEDAPGGGALLRLTPAEEAELAHYATCRRRGQPLTLPPGLSGGGKAATSAGGAGVMTCDSRTSVLGEGRAG